MKKITILFIGIAIVAIAIISSVELTLNKSTNDFNTLYFPELKFTYDELNSKLKQNLELEGVLMSLPIKLADRKSLAEFCTFFENEDIQNQVEYCTSTELRDSEENYLGNIHMVGSKQMPKIILAVIQSDPFMKNLPSVKTVFSNLIEDLVCDCWNDVKPSNIETVADWVEKQREFHTSDTKPTSKSNLNLSGMQLQMELTTNTQGYLWKLLISG